MSALFQFGMVLLPVGYLLSALLHGAAFAGAESARVRRLQRVVVRVTLAVHAATLLARWQQVGHFAIDSPWMVLTAVVLAAAATHAWIARRLRHPGTGGVVFGIAFLMQLASSSFVAMDVPYDDTPVRPVSIVHIVTSVLASSALLLSGVHGILYLFLYRAMRLRRFGPLFNHLPDLGLLGRMTRGAALAGFIWLTVGLNVGIGVAHSFKIAGFDYLDPTVLVTIFLWLHFGLIAFSSRIAGLSAWRASAAAATGLVAVLVVLLMALIPGVTFHGGA